MTMLLTRREPRENVAFPTLLDRFFADPFFARPVVPLEQMDEGNLAVDISEDERNVVVRASLPGFTKEDVDVEIHDGVLTIKAQHEENKEEKAETYYRKERRIGSMMRRVALPSTVAEGQADAELKDGVLTLRLPKTPEATPKKVKIK